MIGHSPSGEAAVSEACYVVAKASTHDQACRLEHLGHAGAALGSEITKDDDRLLALLDGAALDGRDHLVLGVKDAGLALEEQALLPRDLGNCAAGRKVAPENPGQCKHAFNDTERTLTNRRWPVSLMGLLKGRITS
jgi:hypothetical protein